MTGQPHERHEFYNSVTYTVAITFTVEGGARHGTADRRAKRVAEKLANAAVRTAGVVDVSAVAGFSRDGEIVIPDRVRFSAANTGRGTFGEPDKLDRYLDPEHERGLQSLAADHEAATRRREADRERRRAVQCHNTYVVQGLGRKECMCVYCDPEDHYVALQYADHMPPSPFNPARCVCGTPVLEPGERCLTHRDTEIAVLDGDPSALTVLAEQQSRAPTVRKGNEPPEQELEL